MVKSEDSIDWEPETLRALPLAMFRDNYRRAETKVSGTVSVIHRRFPWSAARGESSLQTKPFGHSRRPTGIAIRAAALNRPADRCDFPLGLGCVDILDPIRRSTDWPRKK